MRVRHERATPQDPLPDWVPMAEQQIADRLATANAAPVTIDVSPPNAKVELIAASATCRASADR